MSIETTKDQKMKEQAKEIKRLRTAFTRLEGYIAAVELNSYYNCDITKVPKKPRKWW